MREIKFRAWNKKIEMMINYKGLDVALSLEGEIMPLNINNSSAEELSYKRENSEEYIIMQYTGLHDKNGKEIYEGDIVKNTIFSSKFNSKYYVEWNENSASFLILTPPLTLSGFQNHFPNYSTIQLEIIGNIYENPKLLKEPKS